VCAGRPSASPQRQHGVYAGVSAYSKIVVFRFILIEKRDFGGAYRGATRDRLRVVDVADIFSRVTAGFPGGRE